MLKSPGIGKILDTAVQAEPAGPIGLLESGEELAPKQLAQDPNRQKEGWLAGDPLLSVRRQSSAGDDTMQVRMEE